jgi:aryl-alcohol dehydrogenase-like predicted oxidoreductase
LGTYRVRAVEEAACTACAAGAGWVDTAPNYSRGQAHRALRPVLADHPAVRVSTKTGYFALRQGREAVAAGFLDEHQAAAGHCLDPAFVRWQTSRSLGELGRADVVFVHNPERLGGGSGLHKALRDAFTVLEEFAHAGLIGGYGVATWQGFADGVFTVPELLGLAVEAAGSREHYLNAVQLPVSLVMDQAMSRALDGRGPLVQARAAGVQTFGSAPLHGGELVEMVTPELVNLIRLGLSPAAACLAAAGSCPSLDMLLISASTRQHWDEATAAVAAPLDGRQLREVLDALTVA